MARSIDGSPSGFGARTRVVVTGMGLVCPLGVGVEPVWKRLVAGRSGLRRLAEDTLPDVDCRVAGVVPTSW